jgi:serine/threonine protein kinase
MLAGGSVGTRISSIGPYEVKEKLGQGAFGVVFRVARRGTPGEFALKVLTALSTEDVQRFLREAELARRIDDPGVVRVLDAGQFERHPYYVMELCRGETLRERLQLGPLPIAEATRIVSALARTVASVHARGVLHRDLKPANVIMDETGRPRLTDFGLARDRFGQSLTRTGEVLGTPVYMAPEQFRDAKHIDNRADVWALGVILYQCLTGRLPFAGRRFDELERSIHSAVIPRPRSYRPDIPPSVEEACMKALARAPGDRYASATELARALERTPDKERSPRSRLVPALVVVGAVATVLAVLAAAVFSTGSPPPSPPPPPAVVAEAPKPVVPAKPIVPEVPQPTAPLKMRNTWERLPPRDGQAWWSWAVFLDGDISNVDYVVYHLHRTFPDPDRTVKTRETRFALRTEGWGTFEVRAEVHTKDGGMIELTHMLEFGNGSGESE